MAKRVARWVIALLGVLIGTALVTGTDLILKAAGADDLSSRLALAVVIYCAGGILFGVLFYFIAPAIISGFQKLVRRIETSLNEIPFFDLAAACAGLVVGLFIAFLLSNLVLQIPIQGVSTTISVFLYVILGWLGWSITLKRKGEIPFFDRARREKEQSAEAAAGHCKILDTSVIIDGRIFDICRTGMIEGTIVIPGFVLNELRHIADSADGLKRNRGRRGLDILNKIRSELDIPVVIEERDYDDVAEVDAKLLRLAQDINGVVVTNDYNLNKVAAVQGVKVFNINELANAVKPVVLPGEEMRVAVIKEGKEYGQGVAYLDDGTMIVVDNGKKRMNEQIDVVVTSVLQTSAGKMIFAKIK